MKIIELEEVDSTSEYIKRLKSLQDVAVIAERQTLGRGTKGRKFVSDSGGLYISILKNHADLPAAEAFRIMVGYCVAVCRTLGEFGLKPTIRWANDVLADGKKICGTLIENTVCGGKIVRSLAGIGINVCNVLPEELGGIAVTMEECCKRAVAVGEVKAALLRHIGEESSIDDYKSYIDYFGKTVYLKTDSGTRAATALDVTADGRLKVGERDGSVSLISCAEVSLRL